MQENELYHHGIPGQRWGQRNGPPYPLAKRVSNAVRKTASGVKKAYTTADDVAKKYRHEKNMKLIQTSGMKNILKHVNEFNDEELKAARDRLKIFKEINDIKNSDKEAGKTVLDKGLEVLKTFGSIGTTVFSFLELKDKFSDRKESKSLKASKKELDALNTSNQLFEAQKKAAKYASGTKDAKSEAFSKAWEKQAEELLNSINSKGDFDAKDAAAMKTLFENFDKIKKIFD